MKKMKRTLNLAAALVVGLALVTPGNANATPEFAKQWNSSCASCHIGAPTGLDEEGVAFKLAGYEMGIEPAKPRPKLFFSFLTDLVTFDSSGGDEEMVGPDAAELFTLLRLDKAGRAKIFAIGELTDDGNSDLNLDFAHGHLQINPLERREQLNLRLGNVEPMTRIWNSDMRRVFESSLWSGVDPATAELAATGGGHHGGSSGRPGFLPRSNWGGDVSSVIGSNLLVTAGAIGDTAYGGVFWKRGGRGFDNSTVPRGYDYPSLSPEEQAVFNRQQSNLARKWERSVIFGASAYAGSNPVLLRRSRSSAHNSSAQW